MALERESMMSESQGHAGTGSEQGKDQFFFKNALLRYAWGISDESVQQTVFFCRSAAR